MSEKEIFLEALDLDDPSRRTAYLDRACAGDAELRRRVEALLEKHESSGEILRVPALRQMAALGAVTSDEEAAPAGEIDLSFLQPPTRPGSLGRLAHYEILEVLGRGGCGTVLKAFDEKLQRPVAVKVMARELAATSPARKRFLREARAAAAVRHANVVSIHDVEERPVPFLVMEYIAGQTLQQRIDTTGPLDLQEVVSIGRQIARSLAAAHAEGLIHRDVKPANILLEQGSDCVKITDFGLARSADDASLTQSGAVAGTPLYMSPEQAQGEPVDHRTDLFSLGSVLYVMCTGRPPFRGATPLAVFKRVVEDQPRAVREIIPEAPEWLIEIIARLHAKRPADRFASAQAVADALAAGPARKAEAKPRPSRRWAAALLLGSLLALGLSEASGVTGVGGAVIRLFSADGTLVVEVDDPLVKVSIDGEEIVITGAGVREIRLKPGQYKVEASRDGKLVRQELITLSRNGRQLLRVSKEAAREVPPPPAVERPALPGADRKAAEYVLSLGGTVRVNDLEIDINAAAGLPSVSFQLTRFDLSDNRKVTDEGLAAAVGCTDIKDLWLGGTPITDAGLAHFKKCKQLKTLYLGNTSVTSVGLAQLTGNKVTHMWLSNAWHIGDEGLASFRGSAEIVVLQLNYTLVTDVGLANFKDCPKLIDINVYGTKVTDEGMAYFQGCKDLQYLTAGKTKVTDKGLGYFKGCEKIIWLNLMWLPIGEAGLANFNGCGELTLLALAGTKVNDAAIGRLKDQPKLHNLDLSSTPVTDEGLKKFRACPQLRTLLLNETQVTDKGIAWFKACTNLTELHLFKTRISDAGLAELKGCKSLAIVHLGETQITDAALAQFKGSATLAHLDLHGANVTDKGLDNLRPCQHLRELVLTKTKVTVTGIDLVRKALPRCRITWDGGTVEPTVKDE
jgi:eukaryotic-like serine/threonine-protein kinase